MRGFTSCNKEVTDMTVGVGNRNGWKSSIRTKLVLVPPPPLLPGSQSPALMAKMGTIHVVALMLMHRYAVSTHFCSKHRGSSLHVRSFISREKLSKFYFGAKLANFISNSIRALCVPVKAYFQMATVD